MRMVRRWAGCTGCVLGGFQDTIVHSPSNLLWSLGWHCFEQYAGLQAPSSQSNSVLLVLNLNPYCRNFDLLHFLLKEPEKLYIPFPYCLVANLSQFFPSSVFCSLVFLSGHISLYTFLLHTLFLCWPYLFWSYLFCNAAHQIGYGPSTKRTSAECHVSYSLHSYLRNPVWCLFFSQHWGIADLLQACVAL